MPSVQVFVDKSLGLDPAKVGQVAHDAVKNGIGKPDMYITVAVTLSDCVMVGGKAQSSKCERERAGERVT